MNVLAILVQLLDATTFVVASSALVQPVSTPLEEGKYHEKALAPFEGCKRV